MFNKKICLFLTLVFLSGILAVPLIVAAQNNPLLGAWQQTEFSFSSKDTSYTVKNPQPSLYIFGKKYYSEMFVIGDKPRQLLPNNSDRVSISDKQIRDTFMPFVANSGTYKIDGKKLITSPIVAL